MPFKSGFNSGLGAPVFTTVDDAAAYPIGTIVAGMDDSLGYAEFIYLPGLAATVVDDVVVYDLTPGAQAIVRSLAATHVNSGRPVAVAKAAIVAGKYGWFQISGCCIVNVTGASAVGKAMLTATAGQLNSAAVAGCQLIGATLTTAIGTPAAGKAYATLNRPSVQTQIT